MHRDVDRKARPARVAVAAVLAAALAGCGSDSPSGPSGPWNGEVLFYAQARNVAPVFTPSAPPPSANRPQRASSASEWIEGSPVKMLFDMLRDFRHPEDQGRIDSHNIYKVFFDAGSMFEGGRGDPANRELPPGTVVAPTFDFGNAPAVYSHGGASDEVGGNGIRYVKSWAYRVDAERTAAVLTWIYDESATHKEYGVIEATLDDATGDVDLDMANHVWYSDTEWFSIRTWLTGNTGTHAFTIKALHRGQSAYGSSWASFVGSGVSRGAGEYFLFEARMGNGDEPGSVTYYKFPADADEDALKTLPAEPAGFDETNDPRGHRAAIPPAAFVATDAPGSATAFDNGNTLRLP